MTRIPYGRGVRATIASPTATRLAETASSVTKTRILPRSGAITMLEAAPRPASRSDVRDRDRAALMLHYVMSPAAVLEIALDHLVTELGAERASAGLGSPEASVFVPHTVVTPNPDLAPAHTSRLHNRHWMMQRVWSSPTPQLIDPRDRSAIVDARPHPPHGSDRLLATRVAADDVPFGIVALDRGDRTLGWQRADARRVQTFLDRWLGPILAASLQRCRRTDPTQLTAAELGAVAELAAGATYVEIAQRLGKSPRTIDNQLRVARQKTGTRNAVELTRWYLDRHEL